MKNSQQEPEKRNISQQNTTLLKNVFFLVGVSRSFIQAGMGCVEGYMGDCKTAIGDNVLLIGWSMFRYHIEGGGECSVANVNTIVDIIKFILRITID